MTQALMIAKKDDWSGRAVRIAKDAFADVVCIGVAQAEPIPDDFLWWEGKLLISFLCPWVLPKALLDRFELAINFHPGPSEYPGTGCYNFAIYQGAPSYGAVCHQMSETVDAGRIIEERRFPILPHETVSSLKNRTMAVMLGMFAELISKLAAGQALPTSDTRWKRKAYTRRELEALRIVTPDMPAEEVRRRVRAVDFPGYPGAVVSIAGVDFAYDPQADGLSRAAAE